MGIGLVFGILTVVFLVGHVLIDAYRMWRQVRRLRHVRSESLDGWQCSRCLRRREGLAGLRHEAEWTATALIFLVLHIVTDFIP